MRSATLLTVLLAAIAAGFAQPPVPLHYTSANVRGTLLRYTTFPSQFITPREVDIWLPESYVADSNTSYPVIYMQDGQNLFDPALNDFNHTEWQVDESITRLVAEKKIQPAIVVGIWNTREKRRQEYMPAKAAALAARSGRIPIVRNDTIDVAEITSDLYLRFLVEELKPFVDANYHTLPQRDSTFLMGSSMGALISAYAISEYPQVFGAAACLSTHWPAAGGVMVEYLATHLPSSATHRFYFDHGSTTLDASYAPFQQRVDRLMKAAGYQRGVNWETKVFPGAKHEESAWAARLDVPLTFLLHP